MEEGEPETVETPRESSGGSEEAVPERYWGWRDVFSKKEAEVLPPHRELDCAIALIPDQPIPHGRVYALTVAEDEVLRQYILENTARGFIRPSTSPAGAPIFFIPKRDCSDLRPCIDYRRLNNITIPYRYPLPLISVLLDQIKGASVFTKLDLRGAYNLLRMKEGEEWKTAFNSRYGHYEYLVMPFGLCNAPAFFQRFIHSVFEDILHSFVIVYLDDILIFSKSEEAHVRHVEEVLQRLRVHRLYAKGSKCLFSVPSVPFLGYIVSEQGFAMDPGKVAAIQDWPPLGNLKALQRMLGFLNYYRKFIPHYARETLAFSELVSPQATYVWGPDQSAAFVRIKKLFLEGVVLQHPDLERQFFVETDASAWATGAILSQKSEKGFLLPVAFHSHKLNPAERNYSAFDAELLAIKLALKEWRHYLEGAVHPVIVITDHRNLEALRKTSVMSPRQSRWTLFFTRFDVRITFRPGFKNVRADALSRMYPEVGEPAPSSPFFPEAHILAAIEAPLSSFLEEVRQESTSLDREGFLGGAGNRKVVDGLFFMGAGCGSQLRPSRRRSWPGSTMPLWGGIRVYIAPWI